MSRSVAVSKDRKILAFGNDNVLKVKNISNDRSITNRVQDVIKCEGAIQVIKISPNNAFVAWLTKQPVQVCIDSLLKEKCSIRIGNDKADIGFQTILWSSDSRFLLVVSRLSVYIDVINIKEKTVFKIDGTVLGSDKKSVCSFSEDGEYFASAERSHPATINIYTTDNWTKVQVLKVRGISNIGGMIWCLDCNSLIVWQSLTHYQLTHCTLDGRVEHETKKDLTVVCTVIAAPNGRLLGVQSDDFKVAVMDILTWQEEAVFEHESVICHSGGVSVLKESLKNEEENTDFLQRDFIKVKDSFIALEPSKHSSKLRQRKLAFSACSSYLATYEPSIGEAIWIWCLTKKKLCSVILLDERTSAVNKFTWDPRKLQLIVDFGMSRIVVWNLENCSEIRAKDPATTVFNSDLYLATLNIVQELDDAM